MLHAAVADARPGEILVVQCHDASFGVWGEVLMTSAMAQGIAGLIIDGSVRDVDALRAARFPVFSRGLALKGAVKARRGLLRQPISCGGLLVWPGIWSSPTTAASSFSPQKKSRPLSPRRASVSRRRLT